MIRLDGEREPRPSPGHGVWASAVGLVRSTEDLGSPFGQIGRDLPLYIPARLIPAMTGLLGVAAYTRFLEPKEYGWYALITSTISFVHALAFSWVGYVIWRYFEKYRAEQTLHRFLSTVAIAPTIVFLSAAVVWYLATVFLSQHFESRFVFLLRLGILVLGAQVGYNFVLTILQVNRESLRYSLYTSATAVGTVLLATGLIYVLRWGAEAILWASAVSMGTVLASEVNRRFRKRWPVSHFFPLRSVVSKLATFGLPQVGILVGAFVLSIADRYMIEAFRSTDEVGVYSAGYTLAEMSIHAPLSIVTLAALPVIVWTFENRGEEETRLLLERITGLCVILLVPAVVGIATLAGGIVDVVFGDSFQAARGVLPWVAGGTFLFGLSQYTNLSFQLKERPRLLLYPIFGAGLLNIVLNVVLIPPLGILGAAYATFIAYAVYFVVSYVVSTRVLPFLFPWRVLAKCVLASIVMYLVLRLEPLGLTSKLVNLVVVFAAGVLSYFAALVALKEETLREVSQHFVEILKRSISRRRG